MAHHPVIVLLTQAIQRERTLFSIMALLLLGGGITACILAIGQGSIPLILLFAIIGMGLTVWGFKVLHDIIGLWDISKTPLMVLLREDPEHIVWVYSIVTEQVPYGFLIARMATMYFKLLDGGEITLFVPHHKAKFISEQLNSILPHATFGYSVERDQWFAADPALLLKN